MIRYEYKRSDGMLLACETCASEAPLAEFSGMGLLTNEPKKRSLCEVCTVTYISNMVTYNKVYSMEEQHIATLLAQVTNHLLDRLTGRGPDRDKQYADLRSEVAVHLKRAIGECEFHTADTIRLLTVVTRVVQYYLEARA